MKRRETGRRGETLARAFLEKQGYRIICANWRARNCEIDLVARKGSETVFVEVRAKSSGTFGTPAESVTAAKRRHLITAAQSYVAEHRIGDDWRIDFIGVTFDGDQSHIEHIPYAVTLD